MPARPRAARTANGPQTGLLLRDWQRFVERVERGPTEYVTGCPVCDDMPEARHELEVLVLRGGRRGRRIAARLRPLDERFERVTTPSPLAPRGEPWWRHRNLD